MNIENINQEIRLVTSSFLAILNPKHRDVIESRFGIGNNTEPQTLESIGGRYNITRERVRQIENTGINLIKENEILNRSSAIRKTIVDFFEEKGKILSETEFFEMIKSDKIMRNQIIFFLEFCEELTNHKENHEHVSYWSTDSNLSDKVSSVIELFYSKLLPDTLLTEEKLLHRFFMVLEYQKVICPSEEIALRWLSISKRILKNPLGEWGKDTTQGSKPSHVPDYAYLILRKHGKPMHFSEIAENVTKTFNIPCHKETCHNELIKSGSFVLVGRGMYALSENGYTPGFTRDVIKEILEKDGPLKKEDIVNKVLEKRVLKKNTILVGLQCSEHFTKGNDGKYSVAKQQNE